jgi:ribosomal protein S18 acetylase RimI-like enzyme
MPSESLDLFAEYLQERRGMSLLVAAEGQGFATYRITPGAEVYIQDIYVQPAFRRYGVAVDLANEIAAMARLHGCTFMLGTLDPTARGATEGLAVMLAYGFRLQEVAATHIILRKEL